MAHDNAALPVHAAPEPSTAETASPPAARPADGAADANLKDGYRLCFEAAPFGIVVHDADGRTLFFNSRLEAISGFLRQEVPDIRTWFEKVYPDPAYRRLVLSDREGAPPAGGIRTRECMITRRDGAIRMCRFTSNRLPSGVRLVFIRDIHDPSDPAGDGSGGGCDPRTPSAGRLAWVRSGEDFLLSSYNAAAAALLGRTATGGLACNASQTLAEHPDLVAGIRRCGLERTALRCEMTLHGPKPAAPRHLSVHLEFVPPNFVQATLEDLTALKHTEARLRDSERRFQVMAELLPEIVFETDAEGRISFINRRGIEMLGFTLQDWPDKPLAFQFVAPEDRERASANFRRVFNGEILGATEYTLCRRDGSRFTAMFRSTTRMADGRHAGTRGIIVDISERKRMEEALRASEEKFSKVFHGSPNSFALTTFDSGRYLDVNASECRMTGYERAETIGRTIFELNYYADPEDGRRLRRLLVAHGPVRDFEFRFRRKSGATGLALMSAGIVEIGGERCIISEVTDITEQKRAAEALKLSEERLRMATEGACIGLWDWDLRTGAVHCNDIYFTMLGLAPGEWTPTYESWRERVHPDDRDPTERHLQEVLAGRDGLFSAEYRMACKDGGWVWIQDVGRVIERDESGRPERALGIHYDISDRKQAAESLGAARDELEDRVAARTAELLAANERLQAEVERRRSAEERMLANQQELHRAGHNLSDANAALRVLLQRRDEDLVEVEQRIKTNVEKLVMPYVDRLGRASLPARQRACVGIIDANLRELVAPFARAITDSYHRLTPTEIQVANLIKLGRSTKEIAHFLSLSSKTVEYHRYNVRIKLGLVGKKVNLRTHLLSME